MQAKMHVLTINRDQYVCMYSPNERDRVEVDG